MSPTARWEQARAEDRAAVEYLLAIVRSVPEAAWNASRAPGKWSPAAVVLHVAASYELASVTTAPPTMRLRVSPGFAWVLGHLLLPMMLATGRFPGGAKAPREVVPDPAEAAALTRPELVARLERAAFNAATALQKWSEDPRVRMTHAYFGSLRPRQALRLLSAHTCHHARSLARSIAGSSG